MKKEYRYIVISMDNEPVGMYADRSKAIREWQEEVDDVDSNDLEFSHHYYGDSCGHQVTINSYDRFSDDVVAYFTIWKVEALV